MNMIRDTHTHTRTQCFYNRIIILIHNLRDATLICF